VGSIGSVFRNGILNPPHSLVEPLIQNGPKSNRIERSKSGNSQRTARENTCPAAEDKFDETVI
jgi:hypothetical protein